jgi:Aspartyl protease
MKYNENYLPSAPTANVKLRNQKTLESIKDVPMLLDTGSDITLLPQSYCEKIGIEISTTEFAELEGFNQTITMAYYVRLDFIFLNKMFRGKFMVLDRESGIIGRDILNKFSIIFNGINSEWNEQQ